MVSKILGNRAHESSDEEKGMGCPVWNQLSSWINPTLALILYANGYLKHDKEIRYDEDGHMFPADYYIYVISVVVFGVLQAFSRKGLIHNLMQKVVPNIVESS